MRISHILLPTAAAGFMLATSAGLAELRPQRPPSAPFETESDLAPNNRIDELVFADLQQLGVKPANLCSDAVFVRRVYLDVMGTLPTAKQASDFLVSRNPNKRQALVDQLLQRDEFADYWAMKWSDALRIKAEFPINLWPNAAQAYHRWVRTSLKQGMPYDQFARQLLTSSGSNFRVPQVNFYRAMQNREPEGIAQTVALTFMGTRAENWPKDRLAAMAAFFSQVGYKQTAEWKEEIIYFDPGRTNRAASNCEPAFPDGTPARLAPDKDPREAFADWLVAPNNPWFARAVVNRVWSWFFGRGIVQEADDLRPDNPPSNPALLAFLEQDLVSHAYDLKHTARLILASKTYQRSSLPGDRDQEALAHFARYPVRRVPAEILIDALNQITGTTEQYSSAIPEPYTFVPAGVRAMTLPDGSISSSFLELFGRSPRDSGLESERNNRPTAAQCLHLLNSSHIQQKLEQSPSLQNLLQSKAPPRDIVSGLYLLVLSRYPTEAEWKSVAEHMKTGERTQREALMDLSWALLNSAEFLFQH